MCINPDRIYQVNEISYSKMKLLSKQETFFREAYITLLQNEPFDAAFPPLGG